MESMRRTRKRRTSTVAASTQCRSSIDQGGRRRSAARHRGRSQSSGERHVLTGQQLGDADLHADVPEWTERARCPQRVAAASEKTKDPAGLGAHGVE